jgi:hypothetical protein
MQRSIISARPANGNANWYFDGSAFYGIAAAAASGVSNAMPAASITYTTNRYITLLTNVAGYWSPGFDGGISGYSNYNSFTTNGNIKCYGQNNWFIMATVDSYNGQRQSYQAGFLTWFTTNAFLGTNYSNIPIGAISHVDEPLELADDTYDYYRDWALGKMFIICAWAGQRGTYSINPNSDIWFQAIGDPFIAK